LSRPALRSAPRRPLDEPAELRAVSFAQLEFAECGSVGNATPAGTARILLPRLPQSANPT
jgi:hypothetical protein